MMVGKGEVTHNPLRSIQVEERVQRKVFCVDTSSSSLSDRRFWALFPRKDGPLEAPWPKVDEEVLTASCEVPPFREDLLPPRDVVLRVAGAVAVAVDDGVGVAVDDAVALSPPVGKWMAKQISNLSSMSPEVVAKRKVLRLLSADGVGLRRKSLLLTLRKGRQCIGGLALMGWP